MAGGSGERDRGALFSSLSGSFSVNSEAKAASFFFIVSDISGMTNSLSLTISNYINYIIIGNPFLLNGGIFSGII